MSTGNQQSFSILTFNIWFEGGFPNDHQFDPQKAQPLSPCRPPALDLGVFGRRFDARMKKVRSIILEYAPDVVCLQEVTQRAASQIRGSEALRDKYHISSNSVGSYGILMLVKHRDKQETCVLTDTPVFTEHAMPTKMDRSLLTCRLQLRGAGGRSIQAVVGTAHFESLSSANIRRQQLRVARDRLQGGMCCVGSGSAILCGDFNFCSYRNFTAVKGVPLENDVLGAVLPGYTDLWPHLRRIDERGYTFDTERNLGIKNHPREQMRYDRILSRCNPQDMRPVSIALVGNRDEDAVWDRTLHPSDHFGLIAVFHV